MSFEINRSHVSHRITTVAPKKVSWCWSKPLVRFLSVEYSIYCWRKIQKNIHLPLPPWFLPLGKAKSSECWEEWIVLKERYRVMEEEIGIRFADRILRISTCLNYINLCKKIQISMSNPQADLPDILNLPNGFSCSSSAGASVRPSAENPKSASLKAGTSSL